MKWQARLLVAAAFIVGLGYGPMAWGVICTSAAAGGNWNATATWTGCTGGNGTPANTPGTADTVIIANFASTVSITANAAAASVTINTGNQDTTLQINTGFSLTTGSVTITSNSNNRIKRLDLQANSSLIVNGNVDLNQAGNNNTFAEIRIGSGANTLVDIAGNLTANAAREHVNFSGNGTLQVGGAYTSGGTLTAGSGTVIYDGAASQTVAAYPYNNLTIAKTASTATLSAATNIGGNLAIDSGVLDGAGFQITGNATGSMTMATGTNLILGSAAAATTFPTGFVNANIALNAASTVTYNSNQAQAISPTPLYGNLVLAATAAVTKTPGGNLDVNGSLTIGANNTLTAGALTHTLAKDFTNNGVFTAGGGTLILDGTTAQALAGSSLTTFNNLTIANTAAAIGPAVNLNVTGTLSLDAGSVLTPVAGVVFNNAAAAGTITGSGTAQVTGSASFASQYKFTTSTLTALTVEYKGTGAQAVSNAAAYGPLTINNPNGVTLAAGTTTVGGTLTLTSGALAVGASALTLNGPAIAGTPGNLTTTSSSTLSFGGASSGVSLPGSVSNLNNLTVANVNGITLNSSPALAGTLTLTSGAVTTGAYRLSTLASCPGSVSQSSGYVIGNLQLSFPVGGATCTYPVGSAATYAPMTIATPFLSSGGTLTGTTIGNEEPQIATSGIDATKDANRYWSVWVAGDTISASSYDASFTFVAADLDLGASATSFVLGKYSGGAWTMPTPVTAGATSTGVTGIAGPIDSITSFAIGESKFVCSTPAGLPAGMTCVCDNFANAGLVVNPSAMYEQPSNWQLSQSSGAAGWPKIGALGFLQMTDSSGNMSTAATVPGSFPAIGNLITIEFRQYAYAPFPANGYGADGMALTLSDASVAIVPGAFGGSLGYAQKTGIDGFSSGWLGVGFDHFGNYSAFAEGRIDGPGARLNAVSVRGSGAGQTGYSYLAGTAANLNPAISSTLATRGLGHSYRIIVDARCYQQDLNIPGLVCNNAGLAKRTSVSVDRDVSGGTSYSSLIPAFDAFSANISPGGQADVPANWKLSFTGSTGTNYSIHELAALKICAQFISPPAGYRIQVDNLTPSTCGTPGGSPSSPIVTVTALDTNNNTVTTYDKTINLSATLSGGGASSATWRKVGAGSDLAGNQYTFVPADNGVAQFYLTDASPQSVVINITENGGSLATTLATPVVYSGGSFNVTNIDTLAADAGGGVVAGRAHLMRVTRTNGCSTDLTYNGSKLLDGWYTPVPVDHPTGANAPQICAPNGGSTCLPATGACQTLSIAAPVVSAGVNNLPALSFSSGIADFCLATSDVGKYSLSLRDDSATPVTGSSGSLTVRPFAVVVSGVKSASDVNNPATEGNTNPAAPYNVSNPEAAPLFVNAGANFKTTVGGYLWNSAGDGNGDGVPDAGVNFSQATAMGISPGYADTVTLSAAAPFVPSGGFIGAMNGAVAVSGGSTQSLSMSYSEVGSFSLQAAPATSYLSSAGVDLSVRIAIFANPASTAQSRWVGRFRPDHFTVSATNISTRADVTCTPPSTFTYMDEPMNAGFTLTAQDLANNTTRNYTGLFAKLPLTPASAFSFAAIDSALPTPLTARLDTTGATTGSWVNGVATITAPVLLRRAATPDGPYENFKIGIKPLDADGVTLVTGTLNLDADNNAVFDTSQVGTATRVRFGRLRLSSAHGSELLKLPVPLEAQYWNGSSGFVTNTDDSCTPIAGSNVTMSDYKVNLAGTPVCETSVPASVVLGGGKAVMIMTRPGAGNNGSVGLTLNLGATASGNTCAAPATTQAPATSANKAYLQGKWSGATYDVNPSSRATFGIYKGGPIIYFREVH
ncbi:MAG: DUF6701 domain-containing protein [Pseudomonadota bacterium]